MLKKNSSTLVNRIHFTYEFRAFPTGGSMNPARSLGPAVSFSVYADYVDDLVWKYHYIYWVGPFAGTLVAALMYRYILS